jgi:uroporphyrin-III C-methyltransferase/precorrin-2 dehydrogenase/sirohydrochlorin ferrochelatase
MSMDRIDVIADALIEHGRPASTPAAVVHRATLDGQRVVRAPLGELAKAVRNEGIGAPSVVVVGDVVDVLGG